MLTAVTTVRFFVDGAVASELAQRGLDMDAWMSAQGAYGDAIITGGRYPRLARVMVEAEGPHARDRAERCFHDGLEHVLDGIAHRIRLS
ncbi:hypothetical protein F9B16_00510 [Actinomadura montaniterrae]|uniref:Tetracycline repressor TetR C-terminal domain-containing protein n=2 Tax=Actinomadura montaniterrae TaxID=1803903 RepID=A0A6L3W9W9_9ACTN|nr:hypothetical protein F9B16_00510 [Actinomadura montaniterrae]